MFRLFRLTLALLIISGTMTLAARLAGTTQPSPLTPLSTSPNGNPCDHPCLFGIRPGKMTIDEAIAVVKTHWFLNNVRLLNSESYSFVIAGNGKSSFADKQFLIRLVPGPGDQKPIMVTGVEIELTEPGQDVSSYSELPIVALGTFMAFFGDPETVHGTSYDNSQDYYFTGQGIMAHVQPFLGTGVFPQTQTYRPRPDDAVTSFQVSEPYPYGTFRGNKWCGFTTRQCGHID